MSRKSRMAIEHLTPMPQHSEGGVTARYDAKVFSLSDREVRGEAHAFTHENCLDSGTAVLVELQKPLTAQFCLRVFDWPCKVEG